MAMFEGKVAIVTGAATGIGRATAIAFAREGAKVVIADVQVDEARDTLRRLRDAGGEGLFVKTDVRFEQDVKALVERAIDAYGRLDFAYNDAGIHEDWKPLHEQDSAAFDAVIETNLRGTWLCMKYEISRMLQSGGGAIVNCTSAHDTVVAPALPLYTASKHAIFGLTRSAALHYARRGIRVNAVSPRAVDTRILGERAASDADSLERLKDAHAMGGITAPEVAGVVVFLCSDEASFITGQSLKIDGGYTIR